MNFVFKMMNFVETAEEGRAAAWGVPRLRGLAEGCVPSGCRGLAEAVVMTGRLGLLPRGCSRRILYRTLLMEAWMRALVLCNPTVLDNLWAGKCMPTTGAAELLML